MTNGQTDRPPYGNMCRIRRNRFQHNNNIDNNNNNNNDNNNNNNNKLIISCFITVVDITQQCSARNRAERTSYWHAGLATTKRNTQCLARALNCYNIEERCSSQCRNLSNTNKKKQTHRINMYVYKVNILCCCTVHRQCRTHVFLHDADRR